MLLPVFVKFVKLSAALLYTIALVFKFEHRPSVPGINNWTLNLSLRKISVKSLGSFALPSLCCRFRTYCIPSLDSFVHLRQVM